MGEIRSGVAMTIRSVVGKKPEGRIRIDQPEGRRKIDASARPRAEAAIEKIRTRRRTGTRKRGAGAAVGIVRTSGTAMATASVTRIRIRAVTRKTPARANGQIG
jgi:hypothetical protein